jgi:hypothetical protein
LKLIAFVVFYENEKLVVGFGGDCSNVDVVIADATVLRVFLLDELDGFQVVGILLLFVVGAVAV